MRKPTCAQSAAIAMMLGLLLTALTVVFILFIAHGNAWPGITGTS